MPELEQNLSLTASFVVTPGEESCRGVDEKEEASFKSGRLIVPRSIGLSGAKSASGVRIFVNKICELLDS